MGRRADSSTTASSRLARNLGGEWSDLGQEAPGSVGWTDGRASFKVRSGAAPYAVSVRGGGAAETARPLWQAAVEGYPSGTVDVVAQRCASPDGKRLGLLVGLGEWGVSMADLREWPKRQLLAVDMPTP